MNISIVNYIQQLKYFAATTTTICKTFYDISLLTQKYFEVLYYSLQQCKLVKCVKPLLIIPSMFLELSNVIIIIIIIIIVGFI